MRRVAILTVALLPALAPATSVKHVERLSLAFAPGQNGVSDEQLAQLAEAYRASKKACSPTVDDFAVVVQAMSDGTARTAQVGGALVALGVASKAIFEGVVDADEIDRRIAAGAGFQASRGTVFIEMVCTPR